MRESNLYLMTGPGQGYREKMWKLKLQIERIAAFQRGVITGNCEELDEGAS